MRKLSPLFALVAALACDDGPASPGEDTRVARVDVAAPAGTAVRAGETIQLTAVARTSAGTVVSVPSFSWASLDTTVARVDATGLVTGVAEGSARITASAGGRTGELALSVLAHPAPVARVEITVPLSSSTRRAGAVGLFLLDVVQLAARAYDAQGNVTTGGHPTWSKDGAAAFVSTTGVVLGNEVGRGIVRVTMDGFSDSVIVDVAEAKATFQQIAPGVDFTCGLAATGVAWCWGDGGFLGNGINHDVLGPVPVAGDQRFVSLAAGTAGVCGITALGARYCWGFDATYAGPPAAYTYTPTLTAEDPAPFASVGMGDRHGCGLTYDGAAWCWGAHELGQIGDGTAAAGQTWKAPTAVAGGHAFASLSVGTNHACGLTAAGEAWCWGYNSSNRLGGSDAAYASTPVKVTAAGGAALTRISAGDDHSCGLAGDGTAWCWGWGPSFGGTAHVVGHTFRSISAGHGFTCAVDTDDRAWCWGGSNQHGELGTGDNTAHAAPTLVAGNLRWGTIWARQSACGTAYGTIFCWGLNGSGQLGDGTTADRNAPVAVMRQN